MKKILTILLSVFVISLCTSGVFASGDVDNLQTNETLPVNNDIFISVDIQNDLDFNCNESVDDVNQSVDIQINESVADVNQSVDIQINENVNNSIPQMNKSVISPNNTNTNNSTGGYHLTKEEFDFIIDFLKAIFEFDKNHYKGPNFKAKVSYGPKLDIKGPNFGNLNPHGPDFKNLYNERNHINDPNLKNYEVLFYHYANIFIDHPEWNIIQCIKCVVDDLYLTSYTDGDVCAIVAEAHKIALRNYNGNDMACKEIYGIYGIYTIMLWYSP